MIEQELLSQQLKEATNEKYIIWRVARMNNIKTVRQ